MPISLRIGTQITLKELLNLMKIFAQLETTYLKMRLFLAQEDKFKPQDISLAASVGVGELVVFKKIKVGVFFTGDELVEPGNPLTPGKIYNSNRYALVALLKQVGCDVINLGNIEDKLEATCEALEALRESV